MYKLRIRFGPITIFSETSLTKTAQNITEM